MFEGRVLLQGQGFDDVNRKLMPDACQQVKPLIEMMNKQIVIFLKLVNACMTSR